MCRVLAVLCLSLLTGGCASMSGLFGNNSGSLLDNGVSAVADHGSDIYNAAENAFSGPSYCQKANSTEVYKVDKGDCTVGDTTIKSWEYNQRLAENQQQTEEQLHSAALAAANKPTYCRTTTSHTAYRPLSGQCQRGEQTITAQEYDAAKAKEAAAWATVP